LNTDFEFRAAGLTAGLACVAGGALIADSTAYFALNLTVNAGECLRGTCWAVVLNGANSTHLGLIDVGVGCGHIRSLVAVIALSTV